MFAFELSTLLLDYSNIIVNTWQIYFIICLLKITNSTY
uniref:Uncharacterized protein n=1 Tax=Arundo donax TaxID=35708 RepID=A0A0A9EVC0_ARUDO